MSSGRISERSRVLLVNDGSKDGTWNIIERLHRESPLFSGVNLTRNRGHQNALLAGLMTAKDGCDMAISMDADLQDDVDVGGSMVEKYYEGNDVVYGVRAPQDRYVFQEFYGSGFLKLMKAMGVEIVFNHADYRLMVNGPWKGFRSLRKSICFSAALFR